MVAIKDFGMPSCCENCNMCDNRNLDTFYCSITLNDVNIDEKAHDCPLVEIDEHNQKLDKIEQIIDSRDGFYLYDNLPPFQQIKEVLEQE